MDKVITALGQMSVDFAAVPMLARTHGQTASPTTVGKEMAVFATRLKRQRDLVRAVCGVLWLCAVRCVRVTAWKCAQCVCVAAWLLSA